MGPCSSYTFGTSWYVHIGRVSFSSVKMVLSSTAFCDSQRQREIGNFPLQKLVTVCYCKGSGCGTVGRAVVSDTRGLGFESSKLQF